MPRPVYTMTLHSPRYHSTCAKCGGKVRQGKKFVIDEIDSGKVYHAGCVGIKVTAR